MRVLDILNSPWAITPDRLAEIRGIYMRHLKGDAAAELLAAEKRLGQPFNSEHKPYVVDGGVAILSVEGVIAKRMNLFSRISGGVSTQLLTEDFRAALQDPAVHSIVLSVDSPGGHVDGTAQLAEEIFQSRGEKPIVTVADGMMASGAYWIGSAADRIFIADETTLLGSIGVIAQHQDISRAEEQAGIKTTEIAAGRYKKIASAHRPITDAGAEAIREQVDHIYSVFVDAVAAQRGVSVQTVLDKMADGKLFPGSQAIQAGLADEVATLEEVVADLNRRASAGSTTRREGTRAKGAVMETTKPKSEAIAAPATPPPAPAVSPDTGAITQARAEAAKGERERITGIEQHAAGLLGNAKIAAAVAELKADGKTTPEQAGARILALVKEQGAQTTLATLAADAPAPAPAAGAPADDAKAKYDPVAMGLAARRHRDELAAKGVRISAQAAMDHVLRAAGIEPGAKRATA